jgi:hypothetical protein
MIRSRGRPNVPQVGAVSLATVPGYTFEFAPSRDDGCGMYSRVSISPCALPSN